MSQHNEKNPHQHQSPLHDSSEAKPGMDSLAPEDGSHRPAAEPTPPGAQPTAPGSLKAPDTRNEKLNSLEDVRKGSENYALTTNQGVRIADDQNSLRAGSRGPTLLEDFILREKITHFDHERIPERIVHARGSAAHGYFQPYKSLSDITKADFLCLQILVTQQLGDTQNRAQLCAALHWEFLVQNRIIDLHTGDDRIIRILLIGKLQDNSICIKIDVFTFVQISHRFFFRHLYLDLHRRFH